MSRCPACGFGWNWRLAEGRQECRRWCLKSLWDASRLDSRAKTELVQRFVWGRSGLPSTLLAGGGTAGDGTVSTGWSERRWLMQSSCAIPSMDDLECDETTFGGARKGKGGWGAAGKVIVLGIVKHNGVVKAQTIPAHDRTSIMAAIQAESREGSFYYTDEWQAYATLRLRGDHVVIRKEKGRPVGRDHINGIEGFWSYAKNCLSR